MPQSKSYFFVLCEELLVLALLGSLFSLEESIVNLAHIDTSQLDLGAGSDGVGLVHSSEGHTIDLVGASHQEQAGCELLQEHNSLSSESACE